MTEQEFHNLVDQMATDVLTVRNFVANPPAGAFDISALQPVADGLHDVATIINNQGQPPTTPAGAETLADAAETAVAEVAAFNTGLPAERPASFAPDGLTFETEPNVVTTPDVKKNAFDNQ